MQLENYLPYANFFYAIAVGMLDRDVDLYIRKDKKLASTNHQNRFTHT